MDPSRTTLIGLVGTTDRAGGAEKAFRAIVTGLRDQVGMNLIVATHVQPREPDDDFDPIVLRPDGVRPGLGMLRRFREVIETAPRPAILFPFQLRANIVAMMANSALPASSRLPSVLNDRSSIEDMLSPQPNDGLRQRMALVGLRRAARFAYRRGSRVVCNARANEATVRAFVGGEGPPVSTIYNPLDALGIQARFPERDRTSWIDESSPVIVTHGRMDQKKGFDTLLRAFALVLERCPQARLRIVGDGPERERLFSLARELEVFERCDFPGFLSDPIAAIEDGDVYVLPSRWEGLPNALLEAIAAGLPSIATRCPTGPDEILEDGRVGRLVAVDAVAEMSEAISEILRNASLRVDLSKRSRRRALDFSLDRAVSEFALLFERVLESR
ncbi:MAG: glycosyltransferase [Myxococcota bacterium]